MKYAVILSSRVVDGILCQNSICFSGMSGTDVPTML